MKFKKYTLTTLACLLLGSMPIQAQNSQKDTINRNPKREGLHKFNDNPNIKKYDEKWLKELSNSDLFFQMSEDVAATPTDVDYSELPTEVLKERLRKLNEKTPFNVEYNPILEQVIKSFLKNRRSSLERLMSLSDYYFPMFEQEMSNQKIPLEMKYLAIIESALNPKARSRAGATGLWQFMYATGKSYGLEVNNYVDERSDPVRSTKAAAKYLNELYKIFGDWDLALAAYNSGPGNVTKAIRRSNGKTNYWNLRPYLPRETQAIPFKDIAEITGMDVQDIQFFNPSYQLDVVPYVEGRNYAVRLPISEIGKFVSNEQAIYNYLNEQKAQREQVLPEVTKGEQYAGGKSTKKTVYTVKKGDNLGKIASRHGVTINNIKRWNRMKSNKVRVGQRLSIYK